LAGRPGSPMLIECIPDRFGFTPVAGCRPGDHCPGGQACSAAFGPGAGAGQIDAQPAGPDPRSQDQMRPGEEPRVAMGRAAQHRQQSLWSL